MQEGFVNQGDEIMCDGCGKVNWKTGKEDPLKYCCGCASIDAEEDLVWTHREKDRRPGFRASKVVYDYCSSCREFARLADGLAEKLESRTHARRLEELKDGADEEEIICESDEEVVTDDGRTVRISADGEVVEIVGDDGDEAGAAPLKRTLSRKQSQKRAGSSAPVARDVELGDVELSAVANPIRGRDEPG